MSTREQDEQKPIFEDWAKRNGYDTAYTYDTGASRHLWLSPMTADLWRAWCAALFIQ